jgi:hypothetical protein
VLLLVLAVLGAASPDVLCLEPGVCTSVTRTGQEGEVQHVRHVDRLPARIDPAAPFAGWMSWPRPPEAVRRSVERGERVEWRAVVAAARLRLALVTRVLTEGEGGPGVLAFLSADPLGGAEAPVQPAEPIAAAETLQLLTPAQASEVARWRSAEGAWRGRLGSEWTAFVRAPRTPAVRAKLLDTLSAPPAPLLPERFLTPEQRTELRRRGHALEGRIVVEDLPADAYRLRVEAVPLEQLVEDWNAGLHGLVSRLERVPRPRFHVRRGHRHEEVSFTLDVRSDVDETRVSQVARRLRQIPGLEADGTDLPPPGL